MPLYLDPVLIHDKVEDSECADAYSSAVHENIGQSPHIQSLTKTLHRWMSILFCSESNFSVRNNGGVGGDPTSCIPVIGAQSLVTMFVTLILYHLLVSGYYSWQKQRRKRRQQQNGTEFRTLRNCQTLNDSNGTKDPRQAKKIRIFMEGAFDMMHFGHMNAFRLGRSLGTHLVVGINSDESITQCKGPPLMNERDRMSMVQSCKFVDQTVPNTPYIMNKEYIDWILETYEIDYIVHGDDPCIVDGKDVYETAKQAGKFRSIPRTEGVSTTDIVGRMLQLLTKSAPPQKPGLHDSDDTDNTNDSFLGNQSNFLTTTSLLQQFSSDERNGYGGKLSAQPSRRVIYIDGAWDMFHPGHVVLLEAAKKRGDYLIVGIHGDTVVNRIRGQRFPLFNLHERVLSVSGCRFVDDVLMDAPYEISPGMIASLRINYVIHGVGYEDLDYGTDDENERRYRHAREAGILQVLQSPSKYCLKDVFGRIGRDHHTFQVRFEKKMKAEAEHYSNKYGLPVC